MNEFKLSVTPDEDVSAILPSYFMYKATVGVSVMTAEQGKSQNIDLQLISMRTIQDGVVP